MRTYTPEIHMEECVLDPMTRVDQPPPEIVEYLRMATQKLDAISGSVSRGETVDKDSHQWMLAQVDFLTDSFGNETLELSDEMRSSVLQLVLAIANLNEQIRHRTSLSL